jgi:hypothetical protein
MDESIWRAVEVGMWVIGMQTAILGGILGFMWTSLRTDIREIYQKIDGVDRKLSDKIDVVDRKLSERIDTVEKKLSDKIDMVDRKLSDKIDNVDRRLCRIEGMISLGECCLIKNNNEKKSE